jgi:lipopolysaccharide transport system permease protein
MTAPAPAPAAGAAAARPAPFVPVSGPAARRRHLAALVVHLAGRELKAAHRFTLLGWAWPLVRQLAQLAVLVFVFGSALDLGIEDFAVFVFTGLVVWTWFAAGVSQATPVLVEQRHLVFSARFPTIALPLVAVAVPLVDLLTALPVLFVMLVAEDRLHATVLLLPLLLAVQFALTAGVALLTSALHVRYRDVRNVVGVGLLLLFYLTPVFYGLKLVPERFRGLLEANPLTALVQIARDLCLEGRLPAGSDVALATGAAAVALALGIAVFRRRSPDFVDEL